MIAALSLTVFLICGEPEVIQAEVGGITRMYKIESYRMEDGAFHYQIQDEEHAAFIAGIEREMRKRGMKSKRVNRFKGCS